MTKRNKHKKIKSFFVFKTKTIKNLNYNIIITL